jgi:hypothetical protein
MNKLTSKWGVSFALVVALVCGHVHDAFAANKKYRAKAEKTLKQLIRNDLISSLEVASALTKESVDFLGALSASEGVGDSDAKSDTSSGLGPYQFLKHEFACAARIHGPRCLAPLATCNPNAAKILEEILPFISPGKTARRVRFHNARYEAWCREKKRPYKPLEEKLLGLRKTALSTLLAACIISDEGKKLERWGKKHSARKIPTNAIKFTLYKFGLTDARKLLRAPPKTPACAGVFSESLCVANPYLTKLTADKLVQKMVDESSFLEMNFHELHAAWKNQQNRLFPADHPLWVPPPPPNPMVVARNDVTPSAPPPPVSAPPTKNAPPSSSPTEKRYPLPKQGNLVVPRLPTEPGELENLARRGAKKVTASGKSNAIEERTEALKRKGIVQVASNAEKEDKKKKASRKIPPYHPESPAEQIKRLSKIANNL